MRHKVAQLGGFYRGWGFTGCGKTLAFGIPAVVHAQAARQCMGRRGPYVLIISPSRSGPIYHHLLLSSVCVCVCVCACVLVAPCLRPSLTLVSYTWCCCASMGLLRFEPWCYLRTPASASLWHEPITFCGIFCFYHVLATFSILGIGVAAAEVTV